MIGDRLEMSRLRPSRCITPRCVAAAVRSPHDSAKGDNIWSLVDAGGNY